MPILFAATFTGIFSGIGLLILLAIFFIIVCMCAPRTLLGWLLFGSFFIDLLEGILHIMAEVISNMTKD